MIQLNPWVKFYVKVSKYSVFEEIGKQFCIFDIRSGKLDKFHPWVGKTTKLQMVPQTIPFRDSVEVYIDKLVLIVTIQKHPAFSEMTEGPVKCKPGQNCYTANG